MFLKQFDHLEVDSIETDGFEACIKFTNGEKLIFRAIGYEGTKLEVWTTKLVTKLVEETVEVEIE